MSKHRTLHIFSNIKDFSIGTFYDNSYVPMFPLFYFEKSEFMNPSLVFYNKNLKEKNMKLPTNI